MAAIDMLILGVECYLAELAPEDWDALKAKIHPECPHGSKPAPRDGHHRKEKTHHA